MIEWLHKRRESRRPNAPRPTRRLQTIVEGQPLKYIKSPEIYSLPEKYEKGKNDKSRPSISRLNGICLHESEAAAIAMNSVMGEKVAGYVYRMRGTVYFTPKGVYMGLYLKTAHANQEKAASLEPQVLKGLKDMDKESLGRICDLYRSDMQKRQTGEYKGRI